MFYNNFDSVAINMHNGIKGALFITRHSRNCNCIAELPQNFKGIFANALESKNSGAGNFPFVKQILSFYVII